MASDRDLGVLKTRVQNIPLMATLRERLLVQLGGVGSGNFGHSGRPGEIGGSGAGDGASPDSRGDRAGGASRRPRYDAFIDQIRQPDGGFTVHATTGEQPTTGYSVSAHKERERVIPATDLTVEDLAEYAVEHADLLTMDDNYFGAWNNPKNGLVYLDVARHTEDRAEAERLAREHDQVVYFDFANGTSVDTPAATTVTTAARTYPAEKIPKGLKRKFADRVFVPGRKGPLELWGVSDAKEAAPREAHVVERKLAEGTWYGAYVENPKGV